MNIPVLRRSLLCGLLIAGCLAGPQAVPREPPPTGPSEPIPSQSAAPSDKQDGNSNTSRPGSEAHALDAPDLSAFMDALVPYAMGRGNIAGGVIVVVKDGGVLFSKGYGWADVANRIPVVADRTVFRPGSVAKLFTWTAVMQLVEQGKLSLDRDVNDYLDFKIPPKFGQPITIRNLMTHTPGFEDGLSEAFVKTPQELVPLHDYMIKHMPARIFPPGKVVAYSNYGASLAGYIVERISGESYNDYIARHIFQPLGMKHSTFVQPLPPALQASMSQGYLTASDEKPVPFEIIQTAPAGAMSATGTDLAPFMIAQLQDGAYPGATILKPETARLMHTPQSQMAAGMNGYDLGFYDENRNGLRIIGHAGDTAPFHSDLHLLLDKGVGIFMSFNSLGTDGEAGKVRDYVFWNFLDRYYPYTPPAEKTVADPQRDAARVVGYYGSSRRIDSALRVMSAFSQAEVTARPDGTIEINALKDLGGTPLRWREVGPLTYREIGGQTHLKFVTDDTGKVSYWISDAFIPVMIFQRMHGLYSANVAKFMSRGWIGVLVLSIAIWFGGWIVRRRFGTHLVMSERQEQLRLASRIGALVLLGMAGAWLGFLVLLEAADGDASVNKWLIVVYCIGVLGIIACLAIIIEAALRVLRGPGGWIVRSGEAVLLLFTLYGLWAMFAYGMANFSLTY